MKSTFYTFLALGGILFLGQNQARATTSLARPADSPTEIQRKTAARTKVAEAKKTEALKKATAHKSKKTAAKMRRAMLVMLGLEESRAVTSPLKRQWQLHVHQKQLKMRARQASKAHRVRCQRQMKQIN